jgi:hypothetical protein
MAAAVWALAAGHDQWGGGRRPSPTRSSFKEHLAYLVLTVGALHIVALLFAVSRPEAPTPVRAGRPALHLRLVPEPPATRSARPERESSVELHQVTTPGEIEHLQSVASPNGDRYREREAPAVAMTRPGQAAEVTIPADPEASVLLARVEALQPIDDDMQLLAQLASEASLVGVASGGSDSANEYWPRPDLTRAPQSRGPIVIEFPPGVGPVAYFQTNLALFIDEAGVVRRVRVDGAPLPEALEASAIRSFLTARFRAGEIAGQAVKSLIHVEVVFDSMSADAARGVRGLTLNIK